MHLIPFIYHTQRSTNQRVDVGRQLPSTVRYMTPSHSTRNPVRRTLFICSVIGHWVAACRACQKPSSVQDDPPLVAPLGLYPSPAHARPGDPTRTSLQSGHDPTSLGGAHARERRHATWEPVVYWGCFCLSQPKKLTHTHAK